MSGASDQSLGSQIRSGIKGIHGVGEAIRGTVLSETDKAFGTSNTAESAKNEAIAQKGLSDAKAADENFGRHHGVASGSTATTSTAHTPTTGLNTAESHSAGAHSVAPGQIGSTGQGSRQVVQEEPGVSNKF